MSELQVTYFESPCSKGVMHAYQLPLETMALCLRAIRVSNGLARSLASELHYGHSNSQLDVHMRTPLKLSMQKVNPNSRNKPSHQSHTRVRSPLILHSYLFCIMYWKRSSRQNPFANKQNSSGLFLPLCLEKLLAGILFESLAHTLERLTLQRTLYLIHKT